MFESLNNNFDTDFVLKVMKDYRRFVGLIIITLVLWAVVLFVLLTSWIFSLAETSGDKHSGILENGMLSVILGELDYVYIDITEYGLNPSDYDEGTEFYVYTDKQTTEIKSVKPAKDVDSPTIYLYRGLYFGALLVILVTVVLALLARKMFPHYFIYSKWWNDKATDEEVCYLCGKRCRTAGDCLLSQPVDD